MKMNMRSAIAVAVIIFLLISLAYLFRAINTANSNYAAVLNRKKTLETEVDKANALISSLEAEAADSISQRDELAAKITELQEKLNSMESGHRNQIELLNAQIKDLNTVLANMEKEIPVKDAEINTLRTKIKKGEKKILGLMGKNIPVSLQPITVNPDVRRLDAKVLEVNQSYGFIVLDAGAAEGVRAGQILFVFRKGNLLGKVIVEKVDMSVSVAKILYKSLADEVRKGDMISN